MRRVSSSPHFHSGASTSNIMYSVAAALTPSCIWGVYVFGFRALLVLVLSVFFSVLTEFLLGKVSKEILEQIRTVSRSELVDPGENVPDSYETVRAWVHKITGVNA